MVEPLPTPQPSITVSVVVPVFTGEAFLHELTREVERLRQRWIESGSLLAVDELVFVDDSAIDRSSELVDQIAKEKPWVRVVHLSRNFGQHAAIIAGILHSSGDWVVTLDEDLQHPPAAIPALLRKAAETGCDIVYANPEGDVHERGLRDAFSRGYKRIIKWLTGNPHIRSVNSFRLIRGPIARGASSLSSHDTYFDIALSWFTQRVEVVRMPLKDRRYIATGQSGYTFRSLLSHARRLLVSSQLKVLTRLPWSWDNEAARPTQLGTVASCLERLVRQSRGEAQIDIVWSAGRAGFAGLEEDFRQETDGFRAAAAALAQRLAALPERPQVRVHLISSAGGLFEAQRNVDQASVPNPLRPYGRAKWEQERVLADLSPDITRFIYRPSSAYGFGSRGGRSGLIVTLIHSAINNRTVRIFGKPATLRDFVFADDIGRFVARKIGDRTAKSACVVLASCKPTSMMETVVLVQRTLNKKLLLQFELGGDNTSSNTFSPGVAPTDWKPTPLEIGVAKTAMRIRNDFANAHPTQQTMLA